MDKQIRRLLLGIALLLLPTLSWATGAQGFVWEAAGTSFFASFQFMAILFCAMILLGIGLAVAASSHGVMQYVPGVVFGLGIVGGAILILARFGLVMGALIV